MLPEPLNFMKLLSLPLAAPLALLLAGSTSFALASMPVSGRPVSRGPSPAVPGAGSINPSEQFLAMEAVVPEAEGAPRSGLIVPGKDGNEQAFPLEHTDVQAQIQGNVTRVEVTQTFTNPFDEALEAVYVFPLPDEAAVDEMEIKIGDRVIKGDIKRREEAQEIYDNAIAAGKTAGLLEQERANIFTQSLANIRPGETIDVTIRYSHSLKFEGGNYEFVFPMVVGPRYIPGNAIGRPRAAGTDTDQVPDASRITPPVLKPGTRSGHDIDVTVSIDAGVPIQTVESTSHQINIARDRGGQGVQVQLAAGDSIPNKDLVLRYAVSGKETQATVLSQADDRGGHFAAYLLPAVDYAANEITAKDVVFLMDTSGSQQGAPLAQSKVLMKRFIEGLNPNDTFTIIDFASTTSQLSRMPLANTAANRARAIAYVDALEANGGTELMNGINAVTSFPQARYNRLRSFVLLTDGYIGNDREIIAAVQKKLKQGNRLYSFGVGSSTNRFLLNRLAEVGRGTAQMIRQDEEPTPVVDRFFRQINRPVLTDIQLDWVGKGPKPEIYPQALPDLFDQQPLVVYGKSADAQTGQLKVTGKLANGDRYEKLLDVDFADQQNPAIAQLWGRARIKDLMNGLYGNETTEGVEAVTTTALAYRLLSQYTAFVAVSEEVRVDPDGTRRTVEVPVELPEGVSYEGIFGEEAEFAALSPAALGSAAYGTPAAPRLQSGASGRSVHHSKQGSISINASAGRAPVINSGNILPIPVPEPAPQPTASQSTVADSDEEAIETLDAFNGWTVAQADGLDGAAIAALEKHLSTANVPSPGVNHDDEIVFELQLRNGRAQLVLLDSQASNISNNAVVDPIRQLLKTWQAPAGLKGKVRLVLIPG